MTFIRDQATWKDNIENLTFRGIESGLLDELRQLGPKTADEIAALVSLSDSELNQYVELWQEKSSLARKEAETELQGLQADNQQKIAELRMDAVSQLEQYRQDGLGDILGYLAGGQDQAKKAQQQKDGVIAAATEHNKHNRDPDG